MLGHEWQHIYTTYSFTCMYVDGVMQLTDEAGYTQVGRWGQFFITATDTVVYI
jgi:hypothetical protein